MTPEVIWTSKGEGDLLSIFTQLEDLSEGTGSALLGMVDSGVRLLRLMPKMAPVYSGRIRRLVLRNPRYGLFYVLEYRGIVIHAVCDLRRDRESLIEHLRG